MLLAMLGAYLSGLRNRTKPGPEKKSLLYPNRRIDTIRALHRQSHLSVRSHYMVYLGILYFYSKRMVYMYLAAVPIALASNGFS